MPVAGAVVGDVHLELFWLAYPIGPTALGEIRDLHGIVEEAQWFTRQEIEALTVFPERLKSHFWVELGALNVPNPFIK